MAHGQPLPFHPITRTHWVLRLPLVYRFGIRERGGRFAVCPFVCYLVPALRVDVQDEALCRGVANMATYHPGTKSDTAEFLREDWVMFG